MKNELIKHAIKFGNSAGVILPNNWRYKKVKIQLIQPAIIEDIIEILNEKDLLKQTIGIYLVGSYARGEETPESDIDILVITENLDKQITSGNYEILFISKKRLEKNIRKNLFLISIIKEAKTLFNDNFIKDYKKINPKLALKKYLDEIKAIMKINKQAVELDKKMNKKVADGTAYSIILRLRELYLLNCLFNNKKPTNQEFLKIINKTDSMELYNAYTRIKNNQPEKDNTSPEKTAKIIKYAEKLIKKLKNE
jgi:predicted nucleotidyltransferase